MSLSAARARWISTHWEHHAKMHAIEKHGCFPHLESSPRERPYADSHPEGFWMATTQSWNIEGQTNTMPSEWPQIQRSDERASAFDEKDTEEIDAGNVVPAPNQKMPDFVSKQKPSESQTHPSQNPGEIQDFDQSALLGRAPWEGASWMHMDHYMTCASNIFCWKRQLWASGICSACVLSV